MGISAKTRAIVWGRSAGRCQFPGCNKHLIGDLVAGNDTLKTGYVAHIVAASPNGPRGDPERSPLLEDEPSNLMLLCDPHHKLIDSDEEVANYPEERLIAIRKEADRRIERVTAVAEDRASHVLRYGAMIGRNESVVAMPKCREAMVATHYPASLDPIDLSMAGVRLVDSDPDYFPLQVKNLRRQFDSKVNGRLENQDIKHLSVFALAPIPLLIELGRLLSDITPTEVYQLHREPTGWQWARDKPVLQYQLSEPERRLTSVALKIGVSAAICDSRIHSVLGSDVSIWAINIDNPHNDIMRRPEDLATFRRLFRSVLSSIKDHHGPNVSVCLFPAVPVSIAVEIGRVWMPKADLPLRIFDESRADGGFVERHQLGLWP